MILEQQPLWIIAQILRDIPETTRQQVTTEFELPNARWEEGAIAVLEVAAQELVLSKYEHTVGDILQGANYLKYQDGPRRRAFCLIAWAIEQMDSPPDPLPSIEEAANHIMNVWAFLLICAIKRKHHQSIEALSHEINLLNQLFFPLGA